MRWLLLALLVSLPAAAEGIAVEPWAGDNGLAAALDGEVLRALRSVHPRVVELMGACDVDCARALEVGAVVQRAARGGRSEPPCVEVSLRPLSGEPRTFARCRATPTALAATIRAEMPDALRGPLRTWRAPIEDIRDEDTVAVAPPGPGSSLKAPAPAGNALTTAGAWTVGVGAALAVAGVGTALGLLPVLSDPRAERGAKDIALNTGRASLFAGVSLGIATSATGALIWGIGARELER